jgi:hypothetical protein
LLRKTTKIAVYLWDLALEFGKWKSRTHPATSARLLFCALSDRTAETNDTSKTHASRRKSFPTLLVMKDNANIGARTSMQKAVLTMVCSAILTPLSE